MFTSCEKKTVRRMHVSCERGRKDICIVRSEVERVPAKRGEDIWIPQRGGKDVYILRREVGRMFVH